MGRRRDRSLIAHVLCVSHLHDKAVQAVTCAIGGVQLGIHNRMCSHVAKVPYPEPAIRRLLRARHSRCSSAQDVLARLKIRCVKHKALCFHVVMCSGAHAASVGAVSELREGEAPVQLLTPGCIHELLVAFRACSTRLWVCTPS